MTYSKNVPQISPLATMIQMGATLIFPGPFSTIGDQFVATAEGYGFSMQKVMTRALCLAVVTQIIFACTSLQQTRPVAEQASIQSQRVASAGLALLELDQIDTLIRLDNHKLAEQISTVLNAQAAISGKFNLRKLKLRFNKQYIALESALDVTDDSGNTISASVYGDVSLDYSGNHLEWFPRFNQLQVSSGNFSFEQGTYTEATPELNQLLLQRLNTDMADALILNDNNTIPLNAVPLGEIEVGASLPGFARSAASDTQLLNGIFIVVGSATLIEPSVTSIALDLEFHPNLSYCSTDVTISRAGFTSSINEREPAGFVRSLTDEEGVRYFYTEISGAERPLTIIHYWFADGQLLVVDELSVEPSERWRTWSSKDGARTSASHWKVLVVEKESGCIFHSQSIRTVKAEDSVSQTAQTSANWTFATLRNEFNARTAGFSITKDKPDVALVEVRRAFTRDVLEDSLAGLYLEAEFAQADLPQLQFSALMQPFEPANIVCEHRSCPPAPSCAVSLTQCKRPRDTRDCSSCLFRNPLNNRCVSEAEDPICVAARSRQNAKHEADRASCIANAEAAMLECEQLNAQALRSCEIESGFEQSACEAVKSGIASLQKGSPLATSEAQAAIQGRLSAVFSNISIDDDFTRLKMDMALNSNMKLEGMLEFNPGDLPPALVSCISAWSAPFTSRAITSSAVTSMLTNLSETDNAFTANWSGYILPLELIPSPLESIFLYSPNLLANCSIGLTVRDVERVFMGDDAGFFTGQLELEIQPQPAVISLFPVTMQYGEREFQGKAVITSTHVRYDITDKKFTASASL
jgi:hypothetical protein